MLVVLPINNQLCSHYVNDYCSVCLGNLAMVVLSVYNVI